MARRGDSERPRSPILRPDDRRRRALTASAVAPRSAASRARAADSTETLADGSRTAPAASAITRISDAEAPATNREPEAALSTFRYATARPFNHAACSSAHSVDEVSPNSSASQLANSSDRLGCHPSRRIVPSTRISSSIAAVPVDGSTPPKTQASRWLPTMTTESGSSLPRRSPVTVQTGRIASSLRTLTRTGAAPGPTCERNVASPQRTGAEGPPSARQDRFGV